MFDTQGVTLLECVALLKLVWPWGTCVTMGMGFEVIYAQTMLSMTHVPP